MKSDQETSTYVRPLRVAFGRGTRAEKTLRARVSMPAPSAIAPGLPRTPGHNLVFHGGNTITDLVFSNFFVGGTSAWSASDRKSIETSLALAMADQDLNNVMSQYYPTGQITSTFKGSQVLAGPPPETVSQGDVENLVLSLFRSGALDGFDFGSTVFNFLLPSGTLLNTNEVPTASKISPHLEQSRSEAAQGVPHEEEDSAHGLGGFHGSIHVGAGSNQRVIYYAVGVFSEILPNGTSNGIPVFNEPWKNVVATFYHELNEARTDPDVEDAIRAGKDPDAIKFLGWTSADGEECGDFPVSEADPLTKVFKEVGLTSVDGKVPVQFQYSNAAEGPEGPRKTPAPFAGASTAVARKGAV